MMFFGLRELSALCLQSGAVVGLYLTRHTVILFAGPLLLLSHFSAVPIPSHLVDREMMGKFNHAAD
jgi:hypothetical protein